MTVSLCFRRGYHQTRHAPRPPILPHIPLQSQVLRLRQRFLRRHVPQEIRYAGVIGPLHL